MLVFVMFLTKLGSSSQKWFEVLDTTARSQTAVMNLEPGEESGDVTETHFGSDQVLMVLEGEVLAEVAEEKALMRPGHMLLIPAGVEHRFQNQGRARARTFSVYASRE